METQYSQAFKLLVTAALSSAMIAPLVVSQTAQAQQRRGSLRQIPLLENAAYSFTSSAAIGGSWAGFGEPFAEGEREVIAGRQLYNSPFRMRAEPDAYTILSTNIRSVSFVFLRVKFVTPDYSTAY